VSCVAPHVVVSRKKDEIMVGKLLRQVLDKLMVSPVAQEARVQVALPDGKYYDVQGIQLLENKMLGARETHRIVITIQPEQWQMGNVIAKINEFKL